MADVDLIVKDSLQIDLPDKDYTYGEMELFREDENIAALWRVIQSLESEQIGTFDTNPTDPFGWTPVAASIASEIITSDTTDIALTTLVHALLSFSAADTVDLSVFDQAGYAVTVTANDDVIITTAELLELLLVELDVRGYTWKYTSQPYIWKGVSSQFQVSYTKQNYIWIYSRETGTWRQISMEELLWLLQKQDVTWFVRENCDKPWTQINTIKHTFKEWD